MTQLQYPVLEAVLKEPSARLNVHTDIHIRVEADGRIGYLETLNGSARTRLPSPCTNDGRKLLEEIGAPSGVKPQTAHMTSMKLSCGRTLRICAVATLADNPQAPALARAVPPDADEIDDAAASQVSPQIREVIRRELERLSTRIMAARLEADRAKTPTKIPDGGTVIMIRVLPG